MPAPLEYNNLRRMSTITAPTNDIDFDAYDFPLCRPQTDIKDAFESRELEASYCRDFACCGLILTDLHDLLQHYEECHVPLEDNTELYNEDDELDGSIIGTPPFDDGALQLQLQQQKPDDDDSEEGLPALSLFAAREDLDINLLKRKAAAYLTELCQHQQSDTSTVGSTPCTDDEDELNSDGTVGLKDFVQQSEPKVTGKKRPFDDTMERMAQSAVKKLASTTSCDDSTPTSSIGLYLTDQEFLAQAGVLLASSNHQSNQNASKPYKCPVKGCDKAYKNPNGLKYHNQHGHCNLATDENENVASKPYQCALGGCGKRYKNLNGLKYHIEHSHVAALHHTLATFGSSFFQQQQLSPPMPSLSPSSSPELSCLSLPF